MSETVMMTMDYEIKKFRQQHGVYPEKITLPENVYNQLIEDMNAQSWLTGKTVESVVEYKGIKIESDSNINDWIIIAPEYQ